MRTVICAATATIFLGLGMALILQATQASSESSNATLEPTSPPSKSLAATLEPTSPPSKSQPTLKPNYAIAAAPDDLSAVPMPIVYRQVRTVSIIEPTEAGPKNPAGAPAETSRTDYHDLEAPPGAPVDEDRSAAAPKAKATAAAQDVASPEQPSEEDVSSGDRPSRKASHRRKHSRRESRRAQVATAQQPPAAIPAPAAPASTASNETPFHSLGQLFSGGQ